MFAACVCGKFSWWDSEKGRIRGCGLKAEIGIASQSIGAATVDGSGIDTKDYDEALVVLNVGVTDGTLDVKLQESNDNGVSDSFADITGASFTQITTANDEDIYVARIRVKNFERYIRVSATGTGTTTDTSVLVLLGKFDGLAPVSQVNAVEFALDYASNGGTASV